MSSPLVGVIMGSKSDWPQMEAACKTLEQFGVPYERMVVSAHRTPDLMSRYAATAKGRGLQVIIAGAGGAAALPGMTASETRLPVIGVPIQSSFCFGLDSLLSIAQMPGGTPVATMGANSGGSRNAAMMAIRILALNDPELDQLLAEWTAAQVQDVEENHDPKAAWEADQVK